MARPSKLTDAQWEVIGKRLLGGEPAAALSREFKVSKASISVRFSKRIETVKTVAKQIVAAETGMALLNVSEQIAARSLADDLKDISVHIAGAARYGAATSHRLSALAHSEVEKIDDASPLSSGESLRGIAALTTLANESGKIAMNLLAANKDKSFEPDERPTMTLSDFYGGTKP